MASEGVAPPGLWRHRDFLLLWTGQTISVFGSQFTGIALPLIAALTLRATPLQFGILNAIGTAPFLLFGLFVGVWVDRMARRPILIMGDLGRGIIIAAIAVLAFAGALRIEYLYLAAFLTGVLTVFFDVAYQSYLPSLIDRKQLVDANSRLETTRAASQVAGPGIGGLIVQFFSAGLAMVVDALTFFVSVGFLLAIRKREEVPKPSGRRSMAADVREGLGTVFGEPRLRAIGGCTATSNLFFSAIGAIYVLYVIEDLNFRTTAGAVLGTVFGLGSFGALAGAIVAGKLAKRFGVGRIIVLGSLLFGLGALPLAMAPAGPAAIPLLVSSNVIVLFGALVYNVNQVSLRQAITPNRLQGRMNATMRFLVWGTIPLGAILGGLLGSLIGLRPTIWVAFFGASSAVLWVLFSPVRGLKVIPEPVADA